MEKVPAKKEGENWDLWQEESLEPNSSKKKAVIQWTMRIELEIMVLRGIQIELCLRTSKVDKDQPSIRCRITPRVNWAGRHQNTTRTCTASQPPLLCLRAWSTKRTRMSWGPSLALLSTPHSQRLCYRRVQDNTATTRCLIGPHRIWVRQHLLWCIIKTQIRRQL
jgi:hypothetical protein